jgi:hypothetical protein
VSGISVDGSTPPLARGIPGLSRIVPHGEMWSRSCSFNGIVDCRIEVEQERTRRVVLLAGRLSAAAVPDLLAACGVGTGPLTLDLTELVSVDGAGIDALQRIRDSGAKFLGTPGYIQVTLDAATGGPRNASPLEGRRRT